MASVAEKPVPFTEAVFPPQQMWNSFLALQDQRYVYQTRWQSTASQHHCSSYITPEGMIRAIYFMSTEGEEAHSSHGFKPYQVFHQRTGGLFQDSTLLRGDVMLRELTIFPPDDSLDRVVIKNTRNRHGQSDSISLFGIPDFSFLQPNAQLLSSADRGTFALQQCNGEIAAFLGDIDITNNEKALQVICDTFGLSVHFCPNILKTLGEVMGITFNFGHSTDKLDRENVWNAMTGQREYIFPAAVDIASS